MHRQSPPDGAPAAAPGARARFDALLGQMLDQPDRRAEITRQLETEFERDCAVLVLDTCGFSRTTRQHGIYAFLLMVHQMKRLTRPIVTAHGGAVIKEEADNLYCLFADVPAAAAAAHAIMASLAQANTSLPGEFRIYAAIGIARGRVLDLAGEDLFGDAVNIACKLGEDVAGQGMILIAADAYGDLPADTYPARPETVSISGLRLDYLVLREGD